MVLAVRVLVRVKDRGLDEAEPAQALHLGAGFLIGGIEPLVVADLHDASAAVCRLGQFLGLRDAEAERLLDEQVLAGRERRQDELPVPAGRQDEHRVDVGLRDQLAEVGRAPLDVIARADRVERGPIDVGEAGDGEEVRPLGQGRQVHHLRDAAAPDDRDTKRWRHVRVS